MNIIEISNFSSCQDKVKTEETIWRNLEADKSRIDKNIIFVKFPFADLINKKGVKKAQELISSLENKYKDNKLVFICQHIDIKEINFLESSVVYTPHATTQDRFRPIPHVSAFDGAKINLNQKRDIKYAFVGAVWTHVSRAFLFHLFSDNKDFHLQDTGKWHFEKSDQDIKNHEEKFSSILQNTQFSLCPRGTGPSTIRIWDSLALGSIPVIISDGLKMPLSTMIEWDKCCVFIPEKELSQLQEMAPQKDRVLDMVFYGHEIYNKFFNIKNIHETIKLTI